jgi:hypothetical protein
LICERVALVAIGVAAMGRIFFAAVGTPAS